MFRNKYLFDFKRKKKLVVSSILCNKFCVVEKDNERKKEDKKIIIKGFFVLKINWKILLMCLVEEIFF